MTTSEKSVVKVCVTECRSCGHSVASFVPQPAKCPRCRGWRDNRWIDSPTPETVESAKYHDFGALKVYSSGRQLRAASKAERDASRAAAENDGGAGVIRVDGTDCYVEE